ncbi:12083_t:CDS:1 [Racocetra persica]|uniref:12083_t:CDS:1 n=1 Tax=Racocetra persica TaxID=160502 RepID=A0ACA9PR40_9GLOM|nr:12083_t:CDS:1 [Racocetra persica]
MSDEIMMSFPPEINVQEFLANTIEYKQPLNSYMIYRKVYARTLKAKGIKLSLSHVSKLSSKSWENESLEVKQWYKKFSEKVSERYRRTHWRYRNVNPGPRRSDEDRRTLTFVFENPGENMNATPNNIMNSNDLSMCPLVVSHDIFNDSSSVMTKFPYTIQDNSNKLLDFKT